MQNIHHTEYRLLSFIPIECVFKTLTLSTFYINKACKIRKHFDPPTTENVGKGELTYRQPQDVIGGGEGKAIPACVRADYLGGREI